jgi:hypothetical protein
MRPLRVRDEFARRGRRMKATRLTAVVGAGLLVALAGCELFERPAPTLSVKLDPPAGYVPYSALVKASAPPGTFVFTTPAGRVEQESGTLAVDVTTAYWSCSVTWTDGDYELTDTVVAQPTNALPEIRAPLINGMPGRWKLVPFERTLIDFSRSISDGRLVSVSVRGDLVDADYSIFYPPYEAGVCHAEYHLQIVENACIVYPFYKSVESGGLPYTPTGFDLGYPVLIGQNSNALLYEYGSSDVSGGTEIPAQEGWITATAENDIGQRVSRSFSIPIDPCDFVEDWKPPD